MITLTLRPLILTYLLTFADLPSARVDGEILSMAEGYRRCPPADNSPKRYRPHFPLLWTQTHRRAELAFGLRPPGSHRVVFFDGAFGRSARVCLGAIVFEHEKAERRRTGWHACDRALSMDGDECHPQGRCLVLWRFPEVHPKTDLQG